MINKHQQLWGCHLEYVTKTVKSQILKPQTLRKASRWDLLKYSPHHQKYTFLMWLEWPNWPGYVWYPKTLAHSPLLTVLSLVREIVCSQYLPGRSNLDIDAPPMLRQRLIDWESLLPKEMQFQMPMIREAMFLVGMLHMAYKYVLLR